MVVLHGGGNGDVEWYKWWWTGVKELFWHIHVTHLMDCEDKGFLEIRKLTNALVVGLTRPAQPFLTSVWTSV